MMQVCRLRAGTRGLCRPCCESRSRVCQANVEELLVITIPGLLSRRLQYTRSMSYSEPKWQLTMVIAYCHSKINAYNNLWVDNSVPHPAFG
jgi:hypothetical protein